MRREELIRDPEEAFRTAQDAHQARIWTAIPGIVEAADLEAGELTVQPAIQGKITLPDPETGELVSKLVDLPVLIHVPIVWPTAGGFALTFPIRKGDEVLVVFASRAIDSWFQSGGVGAPVQSRMHDLSDGFGIVGVRSGARLLADVSQEAVELRNEDGATAVAIDDAGNVKIRSSANIELDAKGDIKLKADGKIELEAQEITLLAAVKLVLDSILIAFRALAGMLNLGEHAHSVGGDPPIDPPAE